MYLSQWWTCPSIPLHLPSLASAGILEFQTLCHLLCLFAYCDTKNVSIYFKKTPLGRVPSTVENYCWKERGKVVWRRADFFLTEFGLKMPCDTVLMLVLWPHLEVSDSESQGTCEQVVLVKGPLYGMMFFSPVCFCMLFSSLESLSSGFPAYFLIFLQFSLLENLL